MKTTTRNQPPLSPSPSASAHRPPRGKFLPAAALLGALAVLFFGTTQARAQGIPPGCSGSAIGISLFTSAPDVHVGDTLTYSVSVFNGIAGNPTSCDASNITASITTPDGVVHPIVLRRTYLMHTQSDFYTNVVSYVARVQDIRLDGTLRTTAENTATIFQNDTPSNGGANQGVNTEVSQPCIQLLVQCVPSVGQNGAIVFNGTVTNCGNNTLVGVTVTNYVNGGAFPVFFPTNILRGQSVSFTGSYVPADPCQPSTATLVAVATDQFTANPQRVVSTNLTTCSAVITRGIQVTKTCPVGPTAPGSLLTYSGSVSNTGNITVTNVVVVNNQPATNTLVFTRASLAPGEVVTFTGSYIAPTNCSVTDTLTATATGACGVAVSSTATATCALTTAPAITVTAVCPGTNGVSGGTSSYGGVVRNSGNITLNNVVVVSDRPAPNTVVFTVASLAPGASANYSANFTVPLDVCTVTTAVRATGRDSCNSASVTNTASATCAITTAPALAVTLACPTAPSTNGGLITYTGTVRNSGNVTLNNVVVTDLQSSPATVFTTASLAPGATANFTASFTAPTNACSVSSTVSASATDNCTALRLTNTASATCTLATNPRLVVTQNCSGSPASPGGALSYSGSVSNAGHIALTNIVVTNDRSGATSVFTAALLLPGASTNFTGSYFVPTNSGCALTSTLTARGQDSCSGSVVTNAASATCSVSGNPSVTITENCSATPVGPGGTLTFSGTVRNSGTTTLTNLVVTSDRNGATPLLTVATLTAGASVNYTGSYTVPTNSPCALTTVVTVSGRDACSGSVIANNASATCPITGTPRLVVTQQCPLIQVSPGGALIYSGSVSNAGNVTLSNVVVTSDRTGAAIVFSLATLAPRATANFTGTYVTHDDCCVDTSTLTATGRDCNNTLARDTATRTCTLSSAAAISVTKFCPSDRLTQLAPGDRLTYSGVVSNAGNITLTNVTVTSTAPTNGARIFGPVTLAAGESAPYTASFIIPADFCGAETVTARGVNICSLVAVTNTATTACPITLTPSITVVKNCPAQPTPSGGLFAFTGSVSNSGNVTLTNVLVFNSQPSNDTPVFGPVTLAPGARTNFSGSYAAPLDCCVITDTLTAQGQDRCSGTLVTDTSTQVCPLLTAPSLSVLILCPTTPVGVGGVYEFNGLITNTSPEVLTNVYVVSNLPVPGTVLAGPIELAPGEIEFFTGSHTVVAGAGALVVTVSGLDTCQGRTVSAAANCSGPINPPNQPRAITVVINGNGSVSGVAHGQVLNIGQSYTATATPAAGSSFVNYSGGVTGTAPSLTFTMRSNLVLIANFVFNGTNGSNVFVPVAGVFNGLFYNTNAVQNSNAGCFTLTLTASGAYRATVQNQGRNYAVTGAFNAAGHATNTIPRAGVSALTVNWQADLADPDYLGGTVSDGGTVATLDGGRDVFTVARPTAHAGRYTLVIPGVDGATNSPAGDGYGSVVVDADGDVHLSGRLADGTVIVQNTALSKHGEWPVCLALYQGKGLLIGWLQFADDGTNDLAGTVRWMKPGQPTSALYKPGFSVNSDVIGSRYVAPSGTNKMLNITNGVVVLSGGNLPSSSNAVTFGASSKLVNHGTNTLKLLFTRTTGLFTGTFKETGTTKTYAIKGAVLQRQNEGSGYAPGTNQSGRVVFQAAP